MIRIYRTNALNTDFIQLVNALDDELAQRDGEDHAFYDQYNKISKIKHAVVLYLNEQAAGCGGIKELKPTSMEVKRMFVKPENRGRGLAKLILGELEDWALELGYQSCVLETGKRQPEAIALYENSGYTRIPNYGQYTGVENSLCFEKLLDL